MMKLTGLCRFAARLAAAIVACVLTCHVSAQEVDLAAMFRAAGIEAKKASRLAAAARAAEQKESINPLKPFLGDRDLIVCVVAAMMAVEFDPEETLAAVRQRLARREGNEAALVLAFSSVYEKESVDFLLKRFAKSSGKDETAAIEVALRVLTQQSFSGPEAWRAWWKKHRATFEFSEPEEMEEQQERIRAAAIAVGAGKIREQLLSLSGRPGEKRDEPVGLNRSLAEITRAKEEGTRVRLSPAVKAADAHFAASRFEEAEADYAAALKASPGDERARFLHGCVLLQLDRAAAAAEEFRAIVATNPKAVAAAYLQKLSERRAQTPAEDFATAAIEEFRRLDPRPVVRVLGWEDPILQGLFGESMAGAGVWRLEETRFIELLANEEADAKTQLGGALLSPGPMKTGRLRAARERFPKSAPVLGAAMAQLNLGNEEKNAKEMLTLAQQLVRHDPDNALGHYYLAYFEEYAKRTVEDHQEKRGLPLSPKALEHVRRASKAARFDDYGAEFDAAQLQVLEKLAYPFHGRVRRPNLTLPLMRLAQRLRDNAAAEADAGRAAEAEAVLEAIEELGRRVQELRGPVLHQDAGRIISSTGETFHRDREAANDPEKREQATAAWIAARRAEAEELSPGVLALATIPIPRLENAISARSRADGRALLLEANAK